MSDTPDSIPAGGAPDASLTPADAVAVAPANAAPPSDAPASGDPDETLAPAPDDVPLAARAVAPDVVAAVHTPPDFTAADLSAGVAASNVRVLWRGGIPLETMLSVTGSVLFNAAAIAALVYLIRSGEIFSKVDHSSERDMLVHTYLSTDTSDGGTSGNPFAGAPADRDGHPENAPSAHASRLNLDRLGTGGGDNGLPPPSELGPSPLTDSVTPPTAIALGPTPVRVGPRLTAKRPRPAQSQPTLDGAIASTPTGTPGLPAAASDRGTAEATDGTGGSGSGIDMSEFVKNPGLGGRGHGLGDGRGNGISRGHSVDVEPRIIRTPKVNLPDTYAAGLAKVPHAAKFKVTVRADNTLAKIELVQSSGDAGFDAAAKEFYAGATYLAGTRNGEPADLVMEVSYSAGPSDDRDE